MKKKSDENGTFNNQTFTCPLFVVLENMWVSNIYGWRRNGWKSASARPIWSAFNGLEGKAKGGRRNHTFIPSLGRMLFLELSLWNLRTRFFCFLISHDCVCCTWTVSLGLRGRPGHHCSPPAGSVWCLSDKMEDFNCQIQTVNLWEVEGRRAYSEDFLTFHPWLWTLSRRSLYFVALRMFLRMFFDLPEESSRSPVFPSMPSYTTDKHTFGFFHKTHELKPSAREELLL